MPKPETPSESKALQILIIDDEVNNLRLITESLKGYGFELMTALNGEDGLLSAQHGQPDLILLDIKMPGQDGFSVCRQLKSHVCTESIPVIFFTALDVVEDKLNAFQLGAVDYITKPFDVREVMARVLLHLDQYKRQQNLQLRLQQELQQNQAPDSTQIEAEKQCLGLEKVVEYLQQHLESPPSLDKLATIANTNRTTLNQQFHLLYQMSVFDWWREQRLQSAAKQLKTSRLAVLQIAQQVGYSSYSGFIAAFKARFGMSPKKYRLFRISRGFG